MRYPIQEQRHLDIVPRRGLRRRTREARELPRPLAHEVLVYRVGGEFVVDSGESGPRHRHVVDASHVSVVDIGANVPVIAEIALPTAGAAKFTVQVTFDCTVIDPVLVVRNGRADARSFLEGYLRANSRLLELALGYGVHEIDTVRQKLSTWLLHEPTRNPPLEAGLAIVVSSAEILMPAELAEFERQRRELWRSTVLEAERVELVHSLTTRLEDQGHGLRELRAQREREISAAAFRFRRSRHLSGEIRSGDAFGVVPGFRPR